MPHSNRKSDVENWLIRWAPIVFVVLVMAIVLVTYVLDPHWRFSEKFRPETKAARESLTLMKDWASWMSGIQTAALGAIGFFIKSGIDRKLIPPVSAIAASMGAALIANSYVLASLPSIRLRIKSIDNGTTNLDIYEMSLFGWTTGVKLGYVAALQHMFWIMGLAAAVWFFAKAIKTTHTSSEIRRDTN